MIVPAAARAAATRLARLFHGLAGFGSRLGHGRRIGSAFVVILDRIVTSLIALGGTFSLAIAAIAPTTAPTTALAAILARIVTLAGRGLRLLGATLFDDVLFDVLVLDTVLAVDLRHQARIDRDHRMRHFGHVAGGGLELLDGVVGRDQHRIGLDPHRHAITRLDAGDMLALGVHQEVGNGDRRLDQNFARPLAGALLLDGAQDGQRKAVIAADQAGAMAMRTGLRGRFQHARTQALPRHLHQAKARDAADLNPRPVRLELVLEALLDRGVVLALFHVDEVDDDQTGQIAQTQLAGHLVGGLKVGLQRGILDRALFRGPARVHVDGDQRLGHADDDVATGFQLHDRIEHAAQIAFDLIAREQRHLVLVVLHVLGVGRHDHLHEVLGGAITAVALDQNFLDLFRVDIADGPLDQIAFLIDRRGRDGLEGQLADLFPQPHQIFIVAADLRAGALAARRADDQAGAFRHLQLGRDFLQLLAVGGIGDLARNPTTACGIGHQYTVTTGQ